MGPSIRSNATALTVQRHLASATHNIEGAFRRLGSGQRITTAADDAADLGRSQRLRASVRSLAAAARNLSDGESLARAAEGAVTEVVSILIRLREIALQLLTGTTTTDEQTILANEHATLTDELDRVIRTTKFNGIELLAEDRTIDVHAGLDSGETIAIELVGLTAIPLGLAELDLTTSAGAGLLLSRVDAYTALVGRLHAQMGSALGRLSSAARSAQRLRHDLGAADSRIRDADVAVETANLTREWLRQALGTVFLARAMHEPTTSLRLIATDL